MYYREGRQTKKLSVGDIGVKDLGIRSSLVQNVRAKVGPVIRNPLVSERLRFQMARRLKRIHPETLLDQCARLFSVGGTQKRGSILYIALHYDYGNPARGLSFEEYNLFDSITQIGYDVVKLDLEWAHVYGVEIFGEMMLQAINRYNPSYMFVVPYRNELSTEVLEEIRDRTDTVSIVWNCDDHWRFDNYSSKLGSFFNLICTTDHEAVAKYQSLGMGNVHLTQWACNPRIYRKMPLDQDINVSFIGQPHGSRRQIIDDLRTKGVPVSVWGNGWENGRVNQYEMVRIFNRTKINLNLSNTSDASLGDQIKGRNFEVPSCGRLLLTKSVPHLHDYFNVGEDIAVYESEAELVDIIGFYLKHETLRARVAESGWNRVLHEHTYEIRLNEIFRQAKTLRD